MLYERKEDSLMILDGWGHGDKTKSDAIHNANTPFIDSLYSSSNAELQTDGLEVGLPEGQMGNSEVDTSTLAQDNVYQDLAKINKALLKVLLSICQTYKPPLTMLKTIIKPYI